MWPSLQKKHTLQILQISVTVKNDSQLILQRIFFYFTFIINEL